MSRDLLILTPPERQPYAPELPYSAAEDDFAAGRGVLIPSAATEDPELTKQRAELEAEILRQRGEVSAEIDRLLADNHEGELDEQIARLGAALRLLDADLAAARYGSASTVAAMVVSMPAQADSLRQIADPAESRSQAGAMMAEVTISALEHLSVFDMAERFTPEHFAQMSTAQLDAVGRKIDAHVDRSIAASAAFADRIEDVAAANGADISAWREQREELQEDLSSRDPKRRGRAAYLNSANDWLGAQEAGADAAEIEARRQQMEEDRRAFALRLREQAAREAQEQGLSGKTAEEHIARSEREGLAEADAERDRIIADRRRMAAERDAQKQGLTGEAAARFVEKAVQSGADDPAIPAAVDAEQEAAEEALRERYQTEKEQAGREARAVEEVPVAETGTDIADAPAEEEKKAAANPFGLPSAVAAAATASAAPLAGNQAAVEEQEKAEIGQLAAAASPAQPKTPSGEVGKA